MLPFKLVYHDGYFLPLGAHVFPAQKYRLIHRHLLESGIAKPADFVKATERVYHTEAQASGIVVGVVHSPGSAEEHK